MPSWQTIQTLLIFFGPVLLPRAIAFYRSLQNPPPTNLQPLPPKTSHALTILFLTALLALTSTLPITHPENIFAKTTSRLQTPASVLLNRLQTHRPLTPPDEHLRKILDDGGLDARLLYLRFGPQTLTCPFTSPGDLDATTTYLLYAVPTIALPHLLHLFALGIATSSTLTPTGARWRSLATIAGITLFAAEVWLLGTHDDGPNARSTRVSEMDFFYWKILVYRGLAVAFLDGGLGLIIYLSSTGRAFVPTPKPGERLGTQARTVESVLHKLRGLGIVRNGVMRDAGLRRQMEGYWVREGEVMADVLEEAEVVRAQRQALGRIDVDRVRADAEGFLDTFLNGRVVREGVVGEG